MKKPQSQKARALLLFWTLFIGLGAVAGACGMLLDKSGRAMGMEKLLPYFGKLPFSEVLFKDFFFSGIVLLLVIGVPNLTAATLLAFRKKSGVILGRVCGIILMLWTFIRLCLFPFSLLPVVCFILGLCETVTGYLAEVYAEKENFSITMDDYPRVGTNPEKLVVFFSRTGYTKKLALAEANKSGAYLAEITTREQIDGVMGFLQCGRCSVKGWGMQIDPLPLDTEDFARVTVVSPIWAGSLAAPIREFLLNARGKVQECDLVTCHASKRRYLKARKEAEALLDQPMTRYRSVRCHLGHYKEARSKF